MTKEIFTSEELRSPAQPAGIWHDAEQNWLVLMVLDVSDEDAKVRSDWWPDPLSRPVKLPAIIDLHGVSASEDGDDVDFQRWPLMSTPGQPRPHVEITLATDRLVETLVLPPHALGPHRIGEEDAVRLPIDFDATGRYREEW